MWVLHGAPDVVKRLEEAQRYIAEGVDDKEQDIDVADDEAAVVAFQDPSSDRELIP